MFKQIKRLLEAYDKGELSTLGLQDKLTALTEINMIGSQLLTLV